MILEWKRPRGRGLYVGGAKATPTVKGKRKKSRLVAEKLFCRLSFRKFFKLKILKNMGKKRIEDTNNGMFPTFREQAEIEVSNGHLVSGGAATYGLVKEDNGEIHYELIKPAEPPKKIH